MEKVIEEIKKIDNEVKLEVSHVISAIEKWWDEKIKNSPASQDTKIFNHLQVQKTELVKSIQDIGASKNGTV